MDYTLIEYGGGGFINGAVYIDNPSPTIEYNSIRYKNYGLNVRNGSPTISNNDITGNTNCGVYNYDLTTIDAEDNWWGDASGPSDVGPGSGDSVSDDVNYIPWLYAPANPISDMIPSSSQLTYLPYISR